MSEESADATVAVTRDREEYNPLIRALLAIRGSFLLFVATMGVLMVVIGATVLGGTGVLAGMFAIWGVSAILYAAGGFFFMRLIGYR